MRSGLSPDCLADVRRLLKAREGIIGAEADRVLSEIDRTVVIYRDYPDEGERLARRQRRQRWLEELVERAEALDGHLDTLKAFAFPTEAEAELHELRQKIYLLERCLPDLKTHARAVLQRVKVKRGRPVDQDRADLEWRIAETLYTADAPVTTAIGGTFGRILSLVYGEVGLDRGDARDMKKALCRACEMWHNRPRRK